MVIKENVLVLTLPWRCPDGRKYAFVFIGLFILLLIVYGNSFQGNFQFDDYSNILYNPNIQIKILSWPEVQKTFSGISRDGWLRPLSYLSLALNFYLHGIDVFGYHVVNFIIHYLAAVFLFLFLYNTLKLPLMRERYEQHAYDIALLATFLWAISPLQVTAVTYIVQRMASLAGLFYIMAMYLYLKGRTVSGLWKQAILFSCCGLAAGLALASKENAAMLPVSIFVYDLFLIQGISRQSIRRSMKMVVLPGLIFLTIILIYAHLPSLIEGYDERTFTMSERLLTEPRVILFYISLLLYPITSRLTLLHDFAVSGSLFHPWTTLPAIFAVFIVIAWALVRARKVPLLSFCILFFFLNHFIEGSFTPLEIIYEHRNYLPSMLFFLPPAMVIIYGLDYFARKRSIQFLLALMTVFLMAAEGHTVYLRNDLFQDDKIFWSDNVQKAPNLSRPHGNLGVSLFSEGDYPWAFNEFTTALRLANDPNLRMPATWHHNLGTYYLRVEADADKALFHLTEALNIKRAVKVYRQMGLEYDQMALAMLMKGRLDLAEHYSLRAIGYESNNATYHSNLALILLKGGKLDASMRMARRALVLRDNYSGAMNSLAEALRRKGHLARAAVYWERVLQNSPSNINAHLALVEIYHRMGQKQRAVQAVGRLMDLKGERSMNDLFRVEKEYFVAYVPDPKIIKPIFKDILLAVSREVGHAERQLQKLDK